MSGIKIKHLELLYSSDGFTIMELLVATTLMSVFMALLIGHLLTARQTYFDDVIRTRINSNLRSSMDIVSMNVRQAGENLQPSFPVVVLADGASGAPDTLTLRRNMIAEVLYLCAAASIGDTQLTVSSSSLSDPECIASNMASQHAAFETFRTNNGNSVRAFVYDQINSVGEFVDYTNGGNTTDYYIDVSELASNYSPLTTSIYLLEQWVFQLDGSSETFQLEVGGDSSTLQSVAFEISDFQVSIEMDDTSVQTSLDNSSSYTWKDIRQVIISMTGLEQTRRRTITSSLTSQYFPRNVLSY